MYRERASNVSSAIFDMGSSDPMGSLLGFHVQVGGGSWENDVEIHLP